MIRRWKRLLAGVTVVVLSGACTTTPPTSDPPPSGVPVSADEPIPFGSPLSPPSEDIEPAMGELIFVLDSASRSVYQYDVDRKRMLGPAPRYVTLGDAGEEIRTFPGYPTVVANSPPQDLARGVGVLAVAGGDDGTVVLLPDTEEGLGEPTVVELPSVEVHPSAAAGEGTAATGTPFVVEVAWLDERHLLALSSDIPHDVGVGYIIDARAGKVVRHRQLPAVPSDAATVPGGGTVVAAFGGGSQILWIDEQLKIRRRLALQVQPGSVAVLSDRTLAVGTVDPAQERSALVLVDIPSMAPRQIAEVNGAAGGALLAGETIYWALSGKGELATFSLEGTPAAPVPACAGARHLAATDTLLVVTCLDDGTLGIADLDDLHLRFVPAGDFVADLAPPTNAIGA